MADSFTTRLNLTKPGIGSSFNTWGDKLNANLDALDEFAGEIQTDQLAGLPAPGLLAGAAAGHFVQRSVASEAGLFVENGSGVEGNPTVRLDPNGLGAKTPPADADLVIIGDATAIPAFSPRKTTRQGFLTRAALTAPREVFVNLGLQVGGSQNLDLNTASHFRMEIQAGAACRPLFVNRPAAGRVQEVMVDLTLNSVTAVNVPDGYKWAGGSPPTLPVGRHLLRYLVFDTEVLAMVVAQGLA